MAVLRDNDGERLGVQGLLRVCSTGSRSSFLSKCPSLPGRKRSKTQASQQRSAASQVRGPDLGGQGSWGEPASQGRGV